jgi:hypothetical protein
MKSRQLNWDRIAETVTEPRIGTGTGVIHYGRIVFVSKDRPFGFILETNTGKSYFFHQRDTCEPVQHQDLVEFILGEYKGRPVAQQVKRITK